MKGLQLMNKIVTFINIGIFGIVLGQNSVTISDTLSGNVFNLTLQNGSYQFYDGIDTETKGVNGNILGPTLLFNQGDNVDISVNNQLGSATAMHWHGMHVSAEMTVDLIR